MNFPDQEGVNLNRGSFYFCLYSLRSTKTTGFNVTSFAARLDQGNLILVDSFDLNGIKIPQRIYTIIQFFNG